MHRKRRIKHGLLPFEHICMKEDQLKKTSFSDIYFFHVGCVDEFNTVAYK